MSDELSNDDRARIEVQARRWFFDGVPTDMVQMLQLLEYVTLDGDIAEVHRRIWEEWAQAVDDYIDVGCRIVECYANGETTL